MYSLASPIEHHTPSVLTDIPGAKPGARPQRRSPSCIAFFFYIALRQLRSSSSHTLVRGSRTRRIQLVETLCKGKYSRWNATKTDPWGHIININFFRTNTVRNVPATAVPRATSPAKQRKQKHFSPCVVCRADLPLMIPTYFTAGLLLVESSSRTPGSILRKLPLPFLERMAEVPNEN